MLGRLRVLPFELSPAPPITQECIFYVPRKCRRPRVRRPTCSGVLRRGAELMAMAGRCHYCMPPTYRRHFDYRLMPAHFMSSAVIATLS